MVEATVRYGRDTWVGSGSPNRNHNGSARLKLLSGQCQAFIYLKTPVPHGQVVSSAKLQVFAAKTSDWTGTKTLSAKRIAGGWSAGKITWNHQPDVTGATRSTTVTGATDAQLIEIDVTSFFQTFADGGHNYGIRITSDSTTAHRIYGFDSSHPPRVVVSFSDPPSAPTDLVPSGGAVAVAQPVFTFSTTDLSNPGEISAIQVQVDPAASATAPAFDSGEVATTVPEFSPSDAAYTWAGLADGASTMWRVRSKNADGAWGDWSEWVEFSRTSKGTLTITNPAASPNNYVTESTPPILATSGVALDSAEVLIVDAADETDILAESGPFDMAGGTSVSWTPPAGVIHDSGSYVAIVRGTDQVDRVATTGDPLYIEARQTFTFQEDATVNPPGSLTAAEADAGLGVTLSWTRATAPDSWTVIRDGKVIEADIDPADTVTGTSTYSWTDSTARPERQHTYTVRAVVNGRASAKSNSATITPHVEGVWVVDRDRGLSFSLGGDSIGDWAMSDQSTTYEVIGGGKVVVKTGHYGLEGTYQGVMEAYGGRTLDDYRDDFDAIRAQDDKPVRLFAADLAAKVVLLNLSRSPHPETTPRNPKDQVSFSFIEVG